MYKEILTAETSANGIPTAAPANTEATGWWLKKGGHSGGAIGYHGGDVICLVRSTAGSGTMVCKIRLWGYLHHKQRWYPLGPGGGLMNEGNDIEEVSADNIRHAELVSGLEHFDAIYAELASVGGTSTAISVEIA